MIINSIDNRFNVEEIDIWDFKEIKFVEILFSTAIYSLLIISILFLKTIGLIVLFVYIFFSLYFNKGNLEFIVVAILVISTNVLEFAQIDSLPYLQIIPGVRFNALDLLIIPVSISAFLKISKQKNNKYPSEWIIQFMVVLAIIYFFVGVLLNKGDWREAGSNYLRYLVYPAAYYIFLNYFQKKENILRLFYILGIFVFIGLVIQLYESFLDHRLVIPGLAPLGAGFEEKGLRIMTSGGKKLYLLSRVTLFAYFVDAIGVSLIFNKNNINPT